MTTTTISIEQLAELLGGKLWVKGDLKRIYLDKGYNTKKMSTNTFVWQDENGDFKVSCKIDCPSQHDNWIQKEQDQIKEAVLDHINQVIFNLENPEVDYYEFLEQQKEAKVFSESEKKYQAIQNLTFDNVGEYLKETFIGYRYDFDSTIYQINYHFGQLRTQSRFLNEKDDYPAIIYDNMMERFFLKKDKSADQVWSERLGKISVGQSFIDFDDVLEFHHIRSQGKNGPNKKNVFAPKEIPQHILNNLNEVLADQTEVRKKHLIEQVKYHTEQLSVFIEKYKSENK